MGLITMYGYFLDVFCLVDCSAGLHSNDIDCGMWCREAEFEFHVSRIWPFILVVWNQENSDSYDFLFFYRFANIRNESNYYLVQKERNELNNSNIFPLTFFIFQESEVSFHWVTFILQFDMNFGNLSYACSLNFII